MHMHSIANLASRIETVAVPYGVASIVQETLYRKAFNFRVCMYVCMYVHYCIIN